MQNLNNLIPFPLSITSKVFGVLPWGSFKTITGKLSSLYTGILLIIFSSSVMFFTLKVANVSSSNLNRKTLKEIRKLWIDNLMLVYPAIRMFNSLPAFYISFLFMERIYSKILHLIHISDVLMGAPFSSNLKKKQFWYGLIIYLLIAGAICPFNALKLILIHNELLKTLNSMNLLLFPVSFFGNFAVVCVEMQFACICRAIYYRLTMINSRLKNVVDDVRTKRLLVLLNVENSKLVRNNDDRKVAFINRYFSKSEKVKKMWNKLKLNRKRVSQVHPILINCCPKTNYCFQDDHELLEELTSIRLSYRHLHLCLNSVQDMFGILLLFSFCSLFVMMVFFIYFEFYHNKQFKMNIFDFIYLICGWLLHFILRFNLLLWQAHQTTQEANKTEKILPLVMGRQLDQSVKDELQMFSIEVLCSDWKITGCNFFLLKPELFVWTVGGVATYLGIIVNLDGNHSN